jgi:hypothetical protein
MTPLGELAWTTLGDGEGSGSLYLTTVRSDGRGDGLNSTPSQLIQADGHLAGQTVRLNPTSLARASVFAVTANRDASRPSVALATSNGVLIVEPATSGYHLVGSPPCRRDSLGRQSDALTVTYSADNVLAGGHRNGKIWLYDVRGADQTLRIQHPSSVKSIKVIDSNRLLAAGLENQVGFCPILS